MINENDKTILPETFTETLGALKHSLQLTKTEAHDMRERLIAYADMHTAPSGRTSVPSPFFSYRIFYSRAFVAGLLILILVVGAGTGVTYAAGNSLPGQPLYSVKVDVAEPIEGAVVAATGGTSASADWQNTLAERRITEATTLAAENDLGSSTQAYLEDQAALHIAESEDDSAELAAEGNTNAANDIRTDLDARLAAHAELLALIAPRLAAAGDATTTGQVATLLEEVSQAQMGISFDRGSGGVVATTTTTSSSSNTAASTTVTIAVANPSPSSTFHAQEAKFFAENVHILSLLPPATASTSPSKNRNERHYHGGSNDSTTSSSTVTVTNSTTVTTGSDSPADGNSEATTTIQVGL